MACGYRSCFQIICRAFSFPAWHLPLCSQAWGAVEPMWEHFLSSFECGLVGRDPLGSQFVPSPSSGRNPTHHVPPTPPAFTKSNFGLSLRCKHLTHRHLPLLSECLSSRQGCCDYSLLSKSFIFFAKVLLVEKTPCCFQVKSFLLALVPCPHPQPKRMCVHLCAHACAGRVEVNFFDF